MCVIRVYPWLVPGLIAMFEIETHRLTRKFGELVAVRDLELCTPEGTPFGFLGPNGSGKSTTVKLLTGILPPSVSFDPQPEGWGQ